MDACGWDCLCAGPAFFIGLLYGNLDEVFDVVMSYNPDVNICSNDGISPLQLACIKNMKTKVIKLLRAGALVNYAGKTGETALFISVTEAPCPCISPHFGAARAPCRRPTSATRPRPG